MSLLYRKQTKIKHCKKYKNLIHRECTITKSTNQVVLVRPNHETFKTLGSAKASSYFNLGFKNTNLILVSN